jgi:hypothetical protein
MFVVVLGARTLCLIPLVFVFVRMHVCVGMGMHIIAVAVLVGMSMCMLVAVFLLVDHYLLLQTRIRDIVGSGVSCKAL